MYPVPKNLLENDKNILSVRMKELKISEEEYNKCLNQLVDWFRLQPYLPEIKIDDPFVIKTLYANDFSVEKSKNKIESLFTARSLHPHLFMNDDLDSPQCKKMMSLMQYCIMPKLTEDGRRVVVSRFTDASSDNYDDLQSLKLGIRVADIKFRIDSNYKDVYVLDYKYMKLPYIINANPLGVKQALTIITKCFSVKISGIHCVNIPEFATRFLNFIKSLLKKKIADRIFFHAKLEDLYKHVSREYLPKELGGSLGTIDEHTANLYDLILNDDWKRILQESSKEKTDESRRPEERKECLNETFGIDGSFRTLTID